ncbi:alpha/beta fold hydrolase [Hoeflea poritis]|uniref:Alpha/beta hydrolase n=1 Tax=Hoeflea poritis TaxID=2993659 RepID=A0ABT4VHK1_9HYPH|nr:alpha/beta hydrolase [Hoeflea poritis]MDA4844074.1 alpha/beta hydrolase [Hoeflea poritis]
MVVRRQSLVTGDGVSLSYLTGGSGQPLIMLHGWSQSANLFSGQFEALCASRSVFALDWRGHGESEKTPDGYRIARFAKDLNDFLDALGIDRFDVLAHSLGASVFWAYLMLFARQRQPQKLIFVDEPSALLARPDWSESTRLKAGAIIKSMQDLSAFRSAVSGADTPEKHADLMRPMFTDTFDEQRLRNIAAENLKLPRTHAAALLEDNCLQDWRFLIPSIRNPVLVVGGEASVHPLESQQWIAEQIPGASLDVVSGSDGGSHFMFVENPGVFNKTVLRFLSS